MGSKQDILKFIRVGEEPKEMADELGPLSSMLGTWVGSGWNVIAVPDRQQSFQLLVRPIIETLTVTPLGAPVPNRSGPGDENMFIHGVQYEQRVADAESHRPLHIENGMWLWLGASAKSDKQLIRQSTIPHGDSLLAQGSATESQGRPPIDPELSSLPSFRDKQGPLPLGYLEQGGYFLQDPGFDRRNPNKFLLDALEKQQVLRSVNLAVATEPGAIVNIPFVTRNANATSLHSIFWIETIMDPQTQKTFQQLQYSQTVLLEFPDSKDTKKEMIIWPHISVATLIRQ